VRTSGTTPTSANQELTRWHGLTPSPSRRLAPERCTTQCPSQACKTTTDCNFGDVGQRRCALRCVMDQWFLVSHCVLTCPSPCSPQLLGALARSLSFRSIQHSPFSNSCNTTAPHHPHPLSGEYAPRGAAIALAGLLLSMPSPAHPTCLVGPPTERPRYSPHVIMGLSTASERSEPLPPHPTV
jgi:hypothetical protein